MQTWLVASYSWLEVTPKSVNKKDWKIDDRQGITVMLDPIGKTIGVTMEAEILQEISLDTYKVIQTKLAAFQRLKAVAFRWAAGDTKKKVQLTFRSAADCSAFAGALGRYLTVTQCQDPARSGSSSSQKLIESAPNASQELVMTNETVAAVPDILDPIPTNLSLKGGIYDGTTKQKRSLLEDIHADPALSQIAKKMPLLTPKTSYDKSTQTAGCHVDFDMDSLDDQALGCMLISVMKDPRFKQLISRLDNLVFSGCEHED